MVLTQQATTVTYLNGETVGFHTTMVLTQLTSLRKLKNYTQVSIPLWFLRNRILYPMKSRTTLLFPYHYGSYATDSITIPDTVELQFPYHYGSYATMAREVAAIASMCFYTTMVLTQPTVRQ